MHIIEYYEQQFFKDLEKVKKSSMFSEDRISIASLVEGMSSPSHFGEVKKVLLNLENKEFFLFTFMFGVLFNQAMHEINLKGNLHCPFIKDERIPQFCGILSSYSYNFPPSLLILITSTYTQENDENKYLEEFKKLTDFKLDEYFKTIKNNTISNDTTNAINFIFSDIYESMKYNGIPDLKHFKREPNVNFYKQCLNYLSNEAKKYLELESE